ncbi:potassium transporter TrkA [Haladaptatus sp. F3-133]|jgi:TrkA domain protein|uniref:Potassium transporter TrkA n=1 Tax=Halorutilus salinus TaxID=2487751 RepID=A0A9Q4GK55_9EURY|nr:TrkA C-terminal domain-containing protein [Halorutilus salinus]MCX2819861.1 potassium transporter TrkA [Halorutilus salinus]
MDVKESDLPGVGKKFSFESDDNEVIVILHNTGRREVYTRADPDEDSEKVLELSNKEARVVGSILEGAYFQPVPDENMEATLTDDENLIEWVEIEEGSALDGVTISDADIRAEHGVTVVAIQDDDNTVPNPGSDAVLEAGQTLVLVGPREGYETLREEAEDDG